MIASVGRRLANQIRLDARLQWRNGFYLASMIVAVPAVVLLGMLPDPALTWVLPLVLFENTFINTFFFIAGLVLLERDEGSLSAQAVAPLRNVEYLAAKLLTLTALATVEGVVIVLLTFDGAVHLGWLLVGQVSLALLLTLLGLATISGYRTINEFLMPSVAITILLCLPMFRFLEMLPAPLLALHPLEPSMRALVAAFDADATQTWAYPAVAPLIWLAVTLLLVLRRFQLRATGGAQ